MLRQAELLKGGPELQVQAGGGLGASRESSRNNARVCCIEHERLRSTAGRSIGTDAAVRWQRAARS